MVATNLIDFVANTKAKASEVNNNFQYLKDLLDNIGTDFSSFLKLDGSRQSTKIQSYTTLTVTGASNTTPIVLTCTNHGRTTGEKFNFAGVLGNTAANGDFTITKVDEDRISLNGSVGNGVYTSGGVGYQLSQNPENITPQVYVDNKINTTLANITQPGYVPFSVNSGLTSINKVSNTEVSFTLATGGMVCTFPSGKTYTLTTLNNITGISADTNHVFKS